MACIFAMMSAVNVFCVTFLSAVCAMLLEPGSEALGVDPAENSSKLNSISLKSFDIGDTLLLHKFTCCGVNVRASHIMDPAQ